MKKQIVFLLMLIGAPVLMGAAHGVSNSVTVKVKNTSQSSVSVALTTFEPYQVCCPHNAPVTVIPAGEKSSVSIHFTTQNGVPSYNIQGMKNYIKALIAGTKPQPPYTPVAGRPRTMSCGIRLLLTTINNDDPVAQVAYIGVPKAGQTFKWDGENFTDITLQEAN